MPGLVRLAAVGDVMCGNSFYRYRGGVGDAIDRFGNEFVPQPVSEFLRRHDVVIANIECPIATPPGTTFRQTQMRAKPLAAEHLRAWGVSVANLANNHIFEHGTEAARETAYHLEKAGLVVVGAGQGAEFGRACSPARLDVQGLPLTVLGACTLRERFAFDGGADEEGLIQCVEQEARAGRIVVVTIHWGTEHMAFPDRAQRRLASRLADSGARLILGHHPHVVQGIERIGTALVAYSLGNFVFDQLLPDTRWSMVLSISLAADGAIECEPHPCRADGFHRPTFPERADTSRLLDEFARRCKIVATADRISAEEYQRRARAADRRRRLRMWGHVALSVLRQPPGRTAQLLTRPVKRRLGQW